MDIYRVMSGLVDNATSEQLNQPDENSMREVSEIVRSRADMPKEVIKLINNKIMKRNSKITYLTLELLEYLTYTCEITLYNQISTKDFLLKMGTVLKSNDLGQQVVGKSLRLIKCWRDLFNKDLHQLFFQFYESVTKKSVEIPQDYISPYSNLKKRPPPPSSSIRNNPVQNTTVHSSQSQPKLNDKQQQLQDNLEVVKQNISLINLYKEMIDGQDHKEDVNKNDALTDLITVLGQSEKQMQDLVLKLVENNDEDILPSCLQINDDLLFTLERYKCLKKNTKPKPFKGKVAEEQVRKQPNQFDLSSNNPSTSIFAETASALSRQLQKGNLSYAPPQRDLFQDQQQSQQRQQPPQQQQQQQAQQFQQQQKQQQQYQQQQQNQQQQQQQQPIKKPVANLIDLLDDDEPIPNNQQPTASSQLPLQANFVSPSTNYPQPPFQAGFPAPNSINSSSQPPQVSLTQLYQQNSQINNNNSASEQSRYSALSNMNPSMIQPTYNTISGGNGLPLTNNGYGQMGSTINYQNNAPINNGQFNTMNPVYGMGQNVPNRFSTSSVPSTNTGYGTNSFTSSQIQGMQGGIPASSGYPSNSNFVSYQNNAANNNKKDAFDDLDDMFGISVPAQTNKIQQQQQQRPPQKKVEFDLL